MSTIRAAHYGETETRLMADPIVIAMAADLLNGLEAKTTTRDQLAHEDGGARHTFMGAANAQYRDRGGKDGGHLGAIATAILALIDVKPVTVRHLLDGKDVGITRYRPWQLAPGTRLRNGAGVAWIVGELIPDETLPALREQCREMGLTTVAEEMEMDGLVAICTAA